MISGRPQRWMVTQALRRWTESRLQADSPSLRPLTWDYSAHALRKGAEKGRIAPGFAIPGIERWLAIGRYAAARAPGTHSSRDAQRRRFETYQLPRWRGWLHPPDPHHRRRHVPNRRDAVSPNLHGRKSGSERTQNLWKRDGQRLYRIREGPAFTMLANEARWCSHRAHR